MLGGLSAATRALLCQLQPMRDGVLVQGPTADDKLFLFFELKVFIADESAMQSIWRFKGQRAICALTSVSCVDIFNNLHANLIYISRDQCLAYISRDQCLLYTLQDHA